MIHEYEVPHLSFGRGCLMSCSYRYKVFSVTAAPNEKDDL